METEIVTKAQDIPGWVCAVCLVVPMLIALLGIWYAVLTAQEKEDKN